MLFVLKVVEKGPYEFGFLFRHTLYLPYRSVAKT